MQPSYRTRREHPCPRTPPGGVSPTSRPSPAARASASPSRAETLDLLLDHVLIPVLPSRRRDRGRTRIRSKIWAFPEKYPNFGPNRARVCSPKGENRWHDGDVSAVAESRQTKIGRAGARRNADGAALLKN